MITVFSLPDLGEGLTESEIVEWRVAPGDRVELNQLIADVETAKAVVELPSPCAGIVTALHCEPGTIVHVGEPIVSFEVAAVAGETVPVGTEPVPVRSEPVREAVLVGYGAAPERGGRPQRRPRTPGIPVAPVLRTRVIARGLAEPAEPGEPTEPTVTDEADAAAGATGPGVALERAAELREAASVPGERETRTPIRGVRKQTAAAMVRSAFTAPHATEFLTIDVTPTMEFITALGRNRAFAGQRIGILSVVAKALCLAVARTPEVNSRWDDAAGEIVRFHYVTLGIAAATPRGLLVPTIPDADRLSLAGIATALAELTAAARAGTTSPTALRGGTISITNIGVFGIDSGTPILNPGEAAILALGAVRRRPWEHGGEIALRDVLTLSLSFDHRLVDGAEAARFLTDIGTILADPAMVLTLV